MQRAAIGCHERSKGVKLLAGAPDALKGACPVRVGAGMKPTVERQQGASFDLHRDNLICHAFAGWATEAEVEAHIAKLQRLDGGVQERGP
jgi:hypothetical protein